MRDKHGHKRLRRHCLESFWAEGPRRGCFGGSGGGTVNTVQESGPWGGVQPYLQDIYGKAYERINADYQTDRAIPQLSPQTQQSVAMATSQATDPNSPVNLAQKSLGGYFQPGFLSVDSNPAIQSAADAAKRAVNTQFSGDNYGGSANREWLARATAGAVAPMIENQQTRQLQAAQLSPGLQAASTQQLAAAGQTMDQYDTMVRNAPWDLFGRYQGILSTSPGGTVSGQTPYFKNPLATYLGYGLSGLGIYNAGTAAGLWGSSAAEAAPLMAV